MKRRVRVQSSGPPSGAHPRASVLVRNLNGDHKAKSKPVSKAVTREIPAAWLAQLLALSCELPIEQGPEAVTTALVDAVASMLPHHAFGVSLDEAVDPDKPDSARILRSSSKGSRISISPPPARIFPEFACERVLEVDAEHHGIRLHIASTDSTTLKDGTPVQLLVQRVGRILISALRTTRLVSAKGRESLELKGQIIQSEKLASLGQIAAGVVHELNNPLTSIVGYSDYLRAKAERERSDPNDVERLRRIGEAAARILRFSRDLMAYARPSIEPPAPVAVHAIVDQALVFCEHLFTQGGVRVSRAFAAEERPVLGVRDQLTQVFVNLFTNACHAMEAHGGALSVTTVVDPGRHSVKITVADTGHGIESENLKHIFDPFFTTKTEGRGTGLGLSIVRNIVLLHGGAIAVESAPRRGTTFFLELPLAG
ncbi:MAG TPA: ATP-binding protein [Polyangiaceae bacterium]|nr:ATP-binding protein [Polyangiaceae bacterium]